MTQHDSTLTLFYGDPAVTAHTSAQHALAKQAACERIWQWPGLNSRERLVALLLAFRGMSITYDGAGVRCQSYPFRLDSTVARSVGLTKCGLETALRSLTSLGIVERVGTQHYALSGNVWSLGAGRGNPE